jgi:hypothetical protein
MTGSWSRPRENVTFDWTGKEPVRELLDAIMKRTLHEYDHPPDK